MSFSPIGFVFPKPNIPEGGFGYITTETVEILPPTVCPLKADGYYDIPSSTGLDGDHDYYLYVDGQEFKYDYDPLTGSGWGRTDQTDNRFGSSYEHIIPGSITPVPETVIASIKRIDKIIRTIDPEYLPMADIGIFTVIKKGEYGFDVWDEGFVQVSPAVDPLAIEYATIGKMLSVHLDGVDYRCSMRVGEIMGIPQFAYAGNPVILDPECEDTGEPFVIFIHPESGNVCVRVRGTAETHVVGVSVPGAQSPMSTVIDLDAFGLGETVLGLFAQGGGTTVVENDLILAFWQTMSSSTPGKDMRLQMYYDMSLVDIGGVTLGFVGNSCTLVSFSFLVALSDTEVYDIKVSLTLNDTGGSAIVAVKVST